MIVNDVDDIQVKGSSKADEIENTGSNVTIDAGAGNDTITNEGNDSLIETKDGNDSIYGVYNYNVTVDGGAGNDTIGGNFDGSELIGAAGSDIVEVELAEGSTIDGGDSADEISGVFTGSSINGGTGNDTITLQVNDNGESYENTIVGGKGNDLIINEVASEYEDEEDVPGNVYQYAAGDGTDTIVGIGVNDTLHITSGTISKMEIDDEGNAILTIGTGKIILEGAEGKTIWLQNGNSDPKEYPIDTTGGDYIELTKGNDKYGNDRDNVTIAALAGNDVLTNTGAEVSINGGAGNDKITNEGDDVTVAGGIGNDTILNSGEGFVYEYEGGKDVFTSYNGENIVIDDEYTATVSGKDWIIKINSSNTITIKNAADQSIFINDEEIEPPPSYPEGWKFASGKANATIATADNELDFNEWYGEGITKIDGSKITNGVNIVGNNEGNSIKGGKGEDVITGGTGDDSVSLGGGADVYVYTGGDDVIQDYAAGEDTIQIILEDMDDISAETVKNDVIINTSAGTIKILKGANKEFTLIDEDGEEIILNPGPVTITGTAKADTIDNDEDDVVIEALAGNDKIINSGNNVSIYGGKGNDTIENSGDGTTYYFNSGDGKDVIEGFGENDTLIIDKAYTYEVSGNDWVIKINASNTITLKDAASQTIFINNETVEPVVSLPEGWVYSNTKKTAVKASLASAENEIDLNEPYGDGVTVVDGSKITTGVEIIGNDEGNSIKAGKGDDIVTGGEGNDSVSLGAGADIYVYTGGDDLIQDYNAIDTIQFVGVTAEDFTTSIKGNDIIFLVDNKGKLTVKNGVKAKTVTVTDENGEQLYPIDPIVVPEGWKLDTNKKLLQATTASAENEIDLSLEENKYGEEVEKVDASKITDGVLIIGNDLGNSIKAGKGEDTVIGGNGNDTVSLGAGADVYIYTGGDDIITDFGVGEDTVQIDTNNLKVSSFEEVGKDVVVNTNDGTLTIKNGQAKHVHIVDANDKVIYCNEDTLPSGWKKDSTGKTLTATLTSPDDLDLTKGYGNGVEKVDAKKATSGVSIKGNDAENSIVGGTSNDTLDGGDGNDTLTGGKGKDVFIFSGGDNTITDYVEGQDSIQIGDDYIKGFSVDTVGTNVIINSGDNNLTIQKANTKKIIVMDKDGKQIYPRIELEGWKKDSTGKQMIALAGYPDALDLNEGYGDNVEVVDASKAKDGVEITGGSSSVSIKGSKYSDTITGSDDDDKVSLGAGADVYIYTGGDDIIQDYAAVDTIKMDTGEIDPISASASGTNMVFYTSRGNITVTKGNGKNITFVDENDEEIPWEPGTLPSGWKLDSAGVTATASMTSPDNLDLTEPYGATVKKVDASKAKTSVEIIGNDLDNSIKGGSADDVIAGGEGNDTVSLGSGADVYVYSGGDDLIQDFMAGTDSIQVDTLNVEFESVGSSGSNMIYKTNKGNLTVLKGAGKTITFMDKDGNEFDPFDDPEPTIPSGWQLNTQGTMFTASVKTGADSLDLTEDGFESVEKVNGAKLTEGVEIIGNDNNNSLKGGSGDDTIYGGEGNDTVSLGSGADVYVYSSGNDLIQDYKSGTDLIQFTEKVISASVSGSNVVILTEDGGTLTVKGAKGKEISVEDTNDSFIIKDEYPTALLPEGLSYNTAKTMLTASTLFSGDVIDLSEYADSNAVAKIDASKLKTDVSIIGNDLGNSIKAGSGDDTLLGGTGNDTLTGGKGEDVFVYNGGDDVITDYAAGDAIQINTKDVEVTGIEVKGSNVVISAEEGTLTIKSGKGKEISLFDEDGNELWFDEDNNFVSAKTVDSLSELVSTDTFSVGQDVTANKNYAAEVGIESNIVSSNGSDYYGQDENK